MKTILDELIEKIKSRVQPRFSVMDPDVAPVILHLVHRYELFVAESDLFQLLLLMVPPDLFHFVL